MPPRCIPVLQAVAVAGLVTPGRGSAQAGRMAGDCVVWAARAALRGEVGAVVTAPLNKEALSAAGAPYASFPGHTELLQAEAARRLGCTPRRPRLSPKRAAAPKAASMISSRAPSHVAARRL